MKAANPLHLREGKRKKTTTEIGSQKDYIKRYNKLEQAKDKRHRDLYLAWLTNKHKHITSNDAAMTYYDETYLERDLKVIHFPKNEKKPFEFVGKHVGFLTEADFDDDGTA